MATSLEWHPAYFEDDPRMDHEDIGLNLTFPKFEPYISFEGIPDIHLDAWKTFLISLFEYTGRSWVPRRCGQAPYIQDIADALIDRYPRDIPFKSPMTKSYSPSRHALHYWVEVTNPNNGGILVIDPFGVDPSLTWNTAHTIPYFGRPEYASAQHQAVYLHHQS